MLNPDMISEYINRNRAHPIALAVVFRSNKPAIASKCLSWFVTPRLQPRLESVCMRVENSIESEPWYDLLKGLFVPAQRYQQLRTLSIGLPLNFVTQSTNLNGGLSAFVQAPELRNLRLRGLVVNSKNCAIEYPLLKALSITDTYLDRPIHAILGGMPELEYLSLIYVERSIAEDAIDLSTPGGGLVLKNLRTLRILRPVQDLQFEINSLLTLLHAPDIKHFEWEVDYGYNATPLLFWERCAFQFHALTSLHLMGFPSKAPGGVAALQVLLDWLESLNHLESFRLIFARVCLYGSAETESGVVTILGRLAQTQGDHPACCAQLHSLHIGPVLPRELSGVQSVVQARPRLRAGVLRVVQYVDSRRFAGDGSWLQTNVSDFALTTVSGHGRGFHYGTRHRYVGEGLWKCSSIMSESMYFDQAEQSGPLI